MAGVGDEHDGGGPRRRLLVFAHRGSWFGRHHRRNSMEAFADGLELGVDLESDVRLSGDRVPVLVHDAVVWYAFVPIVVGWLPARWLRRFGIPSLDDLYRTLGHDYELSLDLKVVRAAGPAIEVARRWEAIGRLWLVHDDLLVLDRVRAMDDDVRLVHENRLADLRRIGVDPEAHLQTLAEHHVQAANTHWRSWTPELLAAARSAGVLAFGSLVGHPGQMARVLAVGLDGIYVDHVEAILDELPEADR